MFENFYSDKFRNGVETTTQDYTGTGNKQNDVKTTRRLHESWDYYNRCTTRDRNTGSFNNLVSHRSMTVSSSTRSFHG